MTRFPISARALETMLANGLIRALVGNDERPAYQLVDDPMPHLFEVPPVEEDDTQELKPVEDNHD